MTNVPVPSYTWALLVMSFRDAFLILLIYWIVSLEAKDLFWYKKLNKHLILISVLGILISYFIEMKNVYFLQIWSYKELMPIIPVLNVGLTPVAQLIFTPILTFWILRMIHPKLIQEGKRIAFYGRIRLKIERERLREFVDNMV